MQVSISNLIKGNFIGSAFSAISRYFTRVNADGAIYEAPLCVESGINGSPLLQQASMLMIPSGYKGGTAYAEIPTNGNGDLTWTRASTALRTNSLSLLESMGLNVPRLSYMYGSCPALLLEPQRTNLALYSQDFDNAYWVKNQGATVTANSTTSPDGTTNADTLSVAVLSFSGIYRAISGASANYTISIYAKKNTKNWLYLL